MTVLEVKNIKKSFGQHEVLKEVSFNVPENSVLGFIGQNGAGKTTLMKMIVGLLKQDEGSLHVLGEEVTFGENKTNQWIGYLPDVPEFYGYMTSAQYLKLCGDVTGVPKNELSQRVEELLQLVGLENNRKKIKTFSHGMKQRLGIAQALLNRPKLLICDEPASALDPVGRKEILHILQQVKSETTVIFSTHVLSDVEKICDHIVLLHEGKIRLDMTPSTFKETYHSQKVLVQLEKDIDATDFMSHFEAENTDSPDEYLVTGKDLEATQAALYQYFVTKEIYPRKIEVYQPTLEDIFTEVVS